jgi:hypothetical protein
MVAPCWIAHSSSVNPITLSLPVTAPCLIYVRTHLKDVCPEDCNCSVCWNRKLSIYSYYATYCWKLKLHIYVGTSEIYCFEVS